MRRRLIAGPALVACALAGTVIWSASRPGPPARAASPRHAGSRPATILDVRRVNALQRVQPLPPLHVVVDDAATVARIERLLDALPPAPSGVMSCPADFGVTYRLTFLRGAIVVRRASVDSAGCELVRVGSRRLAGISPAGAAFRDALARAIGLTPERFRAVPSA